ncbi:hypothetical protein [Bradyrhizobium genomosp. I (2014)]|nr:hypothetical protein [Bradyrhizobium sp. CCBAU 43298]
MTATVLVVDDDPDVKKLVVQRFRRHISDGQVSFVSVSVNGRFMS